MRREGVIPSHSLQADTYCRDVDDPNLERLIEGIVFTVKYLERKNKELEERNAELVSTLEQANEKILRFEQTTARRRDLARIIKQIKESFSSVAENLATPNLGHSLAPISSVQEVGDAMPVSEITINSELIDRLRQLAEHLSQLAAVAAPRKEDVPRGCTMVPLALTSASRCAEDRPLRSSESFVGPARRQSPRRFVEIVASPLNCFATLCAFQRAVQRIPGVIDVSVKGYDRGALHLTTEYAGSSPLEEQLTRLPHFDLTRVSVEVDRVEVVVRETDLVEDRKANTGSAHARRPALLAALG